MRHATESHSAGWWLIRAGAIGVGITLVGTFIGRGSWSLIDILNAMANSLVVSALLYAALAGWIAILGSSPEVGPDAGRPRRRRRMRPTALPDNRLSSTHGSG